MSFFDSKRSSGAKMNSFFKRSFVMCSLCLLLLPGCFSNDVGPDKIASINIIDRNGMSETISKKERLDAYQKTDFNSPQPYQKVLRVYGRDEEGSIRSCITSYHPNGEIKQSLEAVNNRAFGSYNEWYPNGQIKIISHVIGGTADLNTQAEESWLFEGINQAWNEDGNLIAEISYVKGELSGESKYYHPNGGVWKISPFIKMSFMDRRWSIFPMAPFSKPLSISMA